MHHARTIGVTALLGGLAIGAGLSGAATGTVVLLGLGALTAAGTLGVTAILTELRRLHSDQTGRDLSSSGDLRPEDIDHRWYDVDGERVLVGVRRGAPPPTVRQVRDAIDRDAS